VRSQQDVSSECAAFLSQDKIRATVRSQTIEHVTSILCNVHTLPSIEVSVGDKHVRGPARC
jgi:hypothetical protein